jgi:hypothetical protein
MTTKEKESVSQLGRAADRDLRALLQGEVSLPGEPAYERIDDVLVAYTDGLTALENPHGNPFGDERLERILYGCGSQDPQKILQLILDELSVHSARAAQADDITLVVMQVKAHQEDTKTIASEDVRRRTSGSSIWSPKRLASSRN